MTEVLVESEDEVTNHDPDGYRGNLTTDTGSSGGNRFSTHRMALWEFHGKQGESVHDWIAAAIAEFEAFSISNEAQRVQLLRSRLGEGPRIQTSHLWTAGIDLETGTSYHFPCWKTLVKELLGRYADPNDATKRRQDFKLLRMERDVVEYADRFKKMSLQIPGIQGLDLISFFVGGLEDRLKHVVNAALVARDVSKMTLTEVIAVADSLHRSLPPVPRPAPEPPQENFDMEIDAIRQGGNSRRCFRCGDRSHFASQCNRAVTCQLCWRDGHGAQQCRQLRRPVTGINRTFYLGGVNRRCNLIHVDIQLESAKGKALVDSGASHVFVNRRWAAANRIKFDMGGPRNHVTFANGSTGEVWKCKDRWVRVGPSRVVMDIYITDLGDNLDIVLGLEWLQRTNPSIDWKSRSLQWISGSILAAPPEPRTSEISFGVINAMEVKEDDLIVAVIGVKSVEDKREESRFDYLFEEFQDRFPTTLPPIGPRSDASHEIKLLDDDPVCRPVIRLSQPELEHLRQALDDLLKQGAIRPSQSPWGAPVFLVKKKDGGYRLVIDYRGLNAKTMKDKYPMPRVDDLLDKVSGHKYYSRLDLMSAYNQVPMEPSSIPLTAMRTPFGAFEYLVMPFGLMNAPPTFVRLMREVFPPSDEKFVVAYVDDILVFSNTIEDHKRHLRTVLQRLRDKNLFVKKSKCVFGTSKTEFLGYQLSSTGISPLASKVQGIVDFPAPSSVEGVRSFLGLAGFYQGFVKDFASLAAPLSDLLRSDDGFHWMPVHAKAFQELKKALTLAPVLRRPDHSRQFILSTDASNVAIGAVLSQVFPDGEHPIAFGSKKLDATQLNYDTYKRELLAIHIFARRWSHYLRNNGSLVMTDHRPLTHLLTQLQFQSPTIARWANELSEMGLRINYRPGAENVVADALSRPDLTLCEASVTLHERTDFVTRIHNELGHAAHNVVFQAVKERGLSWPRMRQAIRQIVAACPACLKVEIPKHAQCETHPTVPTGLFHRLCLDFMGPYPSSTNKSFILTAVDSFSRFPFAQATSGCSAAHVIAFLSEIFALIGRPAEILTDNGPGFRNNDVRNFLVSHGVRHVFASPYRPQANGMIERLNGSLKQVLTKLTADHPTRWHEHLYSALAGLRARPHSTTGHSPYFLVFGIPPRLSVDTSPIARPREEEIRELGTIRSRMLVKFQKQARVIKAKHAKSRTFKPLKVGDAVMKLVTPPSSRKPFTPNWTGPTVITRVLDSDVYRVASSTRAVHRSHLKPVSTFPSSCGMGRSVNPTNQASDQGAELGV